MAQWQATIVDVPDEEFMARGVGVVQTHYAITPWRADLAVSALSVSSAVSTDSTTVRITFDRGAVNNEALASPANYVMTPALDVLSVTPEAVASPTYVDLTTAEQTGGQIYQVEVQRIEAA